MRRYAPFRGRHSVSYMPLATLLVVSGLLHSSPCALLPRQDMHPHVSGERLVRPPQRNKEKFQQLTEFERGRVIALRGGFSYHAIGVRVQLNSSTVMRVWKE
ncbi:hypothetical protein TNCV_3564481 [Trichonephila clavipes]|nr:hypothetical protein TNCV_3564481 [Trichonephila clavipes]